MTDETPGATPQADDLDADLFDYQLIRQWLGFIARAPKRHPILAASAFVFVMLAAISAAVFIPRKYESTAKLLTNRSSIMSTLGNPYRAQHDADSPTRAAYETVMSRENLQKMIKQTKLIDHWKNGRNGLQKLKDQVFEAAFGKIPEEDWMDIMVGTLEKRLAVSTGDGTVALSVVWPEPQMARRLVETAQQNFLEARHVTETSAIEETIGILEMHISQTQTSIDEALANLQKVIEEKRPGKTVMPVVPRAPKVPKVGTPEVPGAELAQLKFVMRTKQRAIADLEENRKRQLADLRTKLDQEKAIYSMNHPVVVELDQRIEALEKDSPTLLSLKADEEELRKEYERKAGVKDTSAEGSAAPSVRSSPSTLDGVLSSMGPDLVNDPSVQVAQDQLRFSLARYQELLMRVEAARIELDTARAAFKYRFNLVQPAQTPRKPTSPNVLMILVGGFIGALGMAVFLAVAYDVWRRRLIEPWQVEQALKIPVLARVEAAALHHL